MRPTLRHSLTRKYLMAASFTMTSRQSSAKRPGATKRDHKMSMLAPTIVRRVHDT